MIFAEPMRSKYNEALAQVEELIIPVEATYAQHVYHVYAIRVKERAEFMQSLANKGIGCGVHYPVPIHLQEAYRGTRLQKGIIPESRIHSRGIRFSAHVSGANRSATPASSRSRERLLRCSCI